jgi:hypothetical protein
VYDEAPEMLRIVALLACACVAACNGDGRPCAPGDWIYCACPAAKRGYSQCSDDGRGYGACDCSGAIPAGAGVLVEGGAPDAAAPDGDKAGFLAPCVNDSDCATNLCFPFNAYGPHCSHPCTKDVDCEAPSPGCSNKNVCKLH